MDTIFILLFLISAACVAWFLYNKKTPIQTKNTPASIEISRSDEISKIKSDLDRHADIFLKRAVSYSAYKICIERSLDKYIQDQVFPNGQIQFSHPSISLPENYWTGLGRKVLESWLLDHGIPVNEGDRLQKKMSDFLFEKSVPLATQQIDEIINATHTSR